MAATWKPHDGPQTEFLRRGEFEILFGGAAGPGKTDCLVIAATRYVSNPNYKALILRRTFPQLEEIMDRCRKYYPMIDPGAYFLATEKRWHFSSGATVKLGHCQHEADRFNYQGQDYGFIGFDEATQFTETIYTYLFSRCRCTDPTIRPMIRATSNPGGEGHQFIKDRFGIGNIEPRTTMYEESVDPVTGEALRLSRAFIPATLEDNPSLLINDPDYLARLAALPTIEYLRLREGRWDAFEGQAFRELNRQIHSIPAFDIPPEWTRYRAFDWGYAKPFSVGWYAVDFDGRIYRYRAWYGCKRDERGKLLPDQGIKMTATDIARGIKERERGERVQVGPAGHDIWSRRPQKDGSLGISVFDEMCAEGVVWIKADNDRLLGRQQFHKRLEVDEDGKPGLYIFQTPENEDSFWRTIPMLREYERNPEEIEEKCEDHCFVGETGITTDRGVKPISSLVGTTGRLWAAGNQWAEYHGCRETRRKTPIVRVTFADGLHVFCTPDHRFLTTDGKWTEAKNLTGRVVHSTISHLVNGGEIWKPSSSAQRFRSSSESGITSADRTSNGREFACIGSCGSGLTGGRFLPGGTFTTPTRTGRIISPGIFRSKKTVNTSPLTARPTITRRQCWPLGKRQKYGIQALPEGNGQDGTSERTSGKRFNADTQRNANNAERIFPASRSPDSVPPDAKRSGDTPQGLIGSSESALFAGRNSRSTNISGPSPALVSALASGAGTRAVAVLRVEEAGSGDVYCLAVDDLHSFALANGVIVHNCYEEVRYFCMSRPMKPRVRIKPDLNSFQAERRKLIKARAYASRHGVSLTDAYGRIR